MSSRSKRDQALRRLHAPGGERTVTKPTLDALTLGTDGTIFVNTGRLATPQNVYDATFASVELRNDAVSLFFGKEDTEDASRLLSRVELRYPIEAFVMHLVRHSRKFHTDMKAQAGKWPTMPERSVDLARLKAAKNHSDWVNFDYMARSGTHASLDFFYLPPSGLARFAQGHGSHHIELMPRIRILTTTHALLRLLDAAVAVSAEARRLLPQELVADAEKAEHESSQE